MTNPTTPPLPSTLLSPSDGDRFELDHGTIRIDKVTPEQVYFVRWHPGEEIGKAVRMDWETWRGAVTNYLTRNDP